MKALEVLDLELVTQQAAAAAVGWHEQLPQRKCFAYIRSDQINIYYLEFENVGRFRSPLRIERFRTHIF